MAASIPIHPLTHQSDELLDAREAASRLRIHHVTLLRWAREGRVPHLRIGRLIRFRASELLTGFSSAYTVVAVRAAQPKGEGA